MYQFPLCLAPIPLVQSVLHCWVPCHQMQTGRKEATWCIQTTLCITFQCIQIQLAECVNNNYSISVVNILPFFSCILKVSIKRTNQYLLSFIFNQKSSTYPIYSFSAVHPGGHGLRAPRAHPKPLPSLQSSFW